MQPEAGSQLSSVQKRPSSQTSAGPESQLPSVGSQTSGPLQALPSSLQVTGGPESQVPSVGSQTSGPLQALPSDADGGGGSTESQLPVVGSQTSPPLQALPSLSHTTGAFTHAPPLSSVHESVVQRSESLQSCAVVWQPFTGSQLSSVQNSPSLQMRGGPEVHGPVGSLQASGPLQALPSSPQTTGVPAHESVSSSQASTPLQARPSLGHGCGTTTQPVSVEQELSVQKSSSVQTRGGTIVLFGASAETGRPLNWPVSASVPCAWMLSVLNEFVPVQF